MNISLQSSGKKFYKEWIFRGASLEFQTGKAYAVLGPNGSGKSTFMQVLAGNALLTEGSIGYTTGNGITVDPEHVFMHVSIAAPYMELIEEFSLREMIEFHRKFKTFYGDLDTNEIIALTGLSASAEKKVRFFSSGMKQRLKLGLAISSVSELLCLDEPLTNLDKDGVIWYSDMISKFRKDRLVIVCSNHVSEEFLFCEEKIIMTDIKKPVKAKA